jgi:hypothetical protein
VNREHTEQVMDLARWVDVNHTSLTQALRMAAAANEADAKRLDEEVAAVGDQAGFPGPTSAVAVVMHQSAASWARLADELDARVNDITVDLYDV